MTHWPQYAIASLYVLNVGLVLSRFGEDKKGKYGFADLIAGPIGFLLLYMGGFWNGVFK